MDAEYWELTEYKHDTIAGKIVATYCLFKDKTSKDGGSKATKERQYFVIDCPAGGMLVSDIEIAVKALKIGTGKFEDPKDGVPGAEILEDSFFADAEAV